MIFRSSMSTQPNTITVNRRERDCLFFFFLTHCFTGWTRFLGRIIRAKALRKLYSPHLPIYLENMSSMSPYIKGYQLLVLLRTLQNTHCGVFPIPPSMAGTTNLYAMDRALRVQKCAQFQTLCRPPSWILPP